MRFNIDRCRTKAHMTQQELADAVGVTAARISSWERGRSSPGAAHVVALCEALSTDPNTLLGWDDEKLNLTFGDRRAIDVLHAMPPELRSAVVDFLSASTAGGVRDGGRQR